MKKFINKYSAFALLMLPDSIGPDGKDNDGAALVVPSGKGTPKGDILAEQ